MRRCNRLNRIFLFDLTLRKSRPCRRDKITDKGLFKSFLQLLVILHKTWRRSHFEIRNFQQCLRTDFPEFSTWHDSPFSDGLIFSSTHTTRDQYRYKAASRNAERDLGQILWALHRFVWNAAPRRRGSQPQLCPFLLPPPRHLQWLPGRRGGQGRLATSPRGARPKGSLDGPEHRQSLARPRGRKGQVLALRWCRFHTR